MEQLLIKKCDFKGCEKAGSCRAPKSRELKEYYWFCKEHAAEYNKNWNYYAGMTPDEIDDDWERETFGASDKDRAAADAANAEYVNFLKEFLAGKSEFDADRQTRGAAHSKAGALSRPSASISAALRVFDLPPTAGWREIASRYRALAKKYHPDTAKNKKSAAEEFTKLTAAYGVLKKWFGK
jgi:hypothetical protein